jgi:hypothetical protein
MSSVLMVGGADVFSPCKAKSAAIDREDRKRQGMVAV